jgi:hypothetical protein
VERRSLTRFASGLPSAPLRPSWKTRREISGSNDRRTRSHPQWSDCAGGPAQLSSVRSTPSGARKASLWIGTTGAVTSFATASTR